MTLLRIAGRRQMAGGLPRINRRATPASPAPPAPGSRCCLEGRWGITRPRTPTMPDAFPAPAALHTQADARAATPRRGADHRPARRAGPAGPARRPHRGARPSGRRSRCAAATAVGSGESSPKPVFCARSAVPAVSRLGGRGMTGVMNRAVTAASPAGEEDRTSCSGRAGRATRPAVIKRDVCFGENSPVWVSEAGLAQYAHTLAKQARLAVM
jgi:hypothetical protein